METWVKHFPKILRHLKYMEEDFMVYHKPIMAAQEDLIEQIGTTLTILRTDLDFLLKLSPRELKILETSVEDLVGQEKNQHRI